MIISLILARNYVFFQTLHTLFLLLTPIKLLRRTLKNLPPYDSIDKIYFFEKSYYSKYPIFGRRGKELFMNYLREELRRIMCDIFHSRNSCRLNGSRMRMQDVSKRTFLMIPWTLLKNSWILPKISPFQGYGALFNSKDPIICTVDAL